MHWLRSHFRYTKQQRNGIFLLLVMVVLILGVYLFLNWTASDKQGESLRFDSVTQKKIDSLKQLEAAKEDWEIRPFNPNFITDFKGYTLGMSTAEIDRLHAFRAQNKYLNSSKEFQQVTLVSDTLLRQLAPLFKFPEWTNKKQGSSHVSMAKKKLKNTSVSKRISDLNTATADDLQSISGIGEVLSNRIIRFRNSLGGFLVNEQLFDVYGLEGSVAERALVRFQVLEAPK